MKKVNTLCRNNKLCVDFLHVEGSQVPAWSSGSGVCTMTMTKRREFETPAALPTAELLMTSTCAKCSSCNNKVVALVIYICGIQHFV